MGWKVYDKRGRLRRDSDGIWGSGASPHYGPRFNFVPPNRRAFRSVSGNAGTLTQTRFGLFAQAPAQASLANLRVWDRPVPASGLWVIRAALWPQLYAEAAVHHCGILLRETSSARLHSVSVWDDNTLTVSRWSSTTLFSSNDLAATSFPGYVSFPRFFTIAYSGSNYDFRLEDGFGHAINLASVSVGAWLTADRVGFYVNAGSINIEAGATLLSWEKTAA